MVAYILFSSYRLARRLNFEPYVFIYVFDDLAETYLRDFVHGICLLWNVDDIVLVRGFIEKISGSKIYRENLGSTWFSSK